MDDLRNILPTGKNNAISARELAAKIGVSDRVLRDIVTEDRVKGIVICSSVRKNLYAEKACSWTVYHGQYHRRNERFFRFIECHL